MSGSVGAGDSGIAVTSGNGPAIGLGEGTEGLQRSKQGEHNVKSSRVRTLALAAAAALGLAACSGGAGGGGQTTPAAPGYDTSLETFYSQTLQWEDCSESEQGVTASCAWVEVPIDYEQPDGDTTRVRVLKVPASEAKDGKSAKGALLVNPGGPGGSATEYALAADWIVSGVVRSNFDVVGFDPRGVGESTPVECVDDAQLDRIMGSDPTPDDQAELDAAYANTQALGEACIEKNPNLIGHVSTVEAAKDMDVIRHLLGDDKLDYLGKSYGTFLGATYAGLFPERVGNMVLDGALGPELDNKELNLGQAEGFESATRAWAQSCVDSGQCPLGSDVDGVMQGLSEFFKELDANPLPVQGDPRVTELTEGWASVGVAQAMYTQLYWDTLTQALAAAKDGDGTPLFSLAQEYAGRSDDGKYDSNIMQVINAVNCLDRGDERISAAEMEQRVAEFEQVAPVWGRMMATSSNGCAAWPVEATGEAGPISASGSGPIVVIGTTRDPATPYAWAQSLADQLDEGRLITYDGDGHTAYMQSNPCVDNAVDNYLMNGKDPGDNTKC